MGLKTLGWLIAIAAVVTPLAYYRFHERPIEVTAVIVERGNVERTVTAISSGTVKAIRDSMIASALIGTVTSLPVEEGQRVEKGAILYELAHEDFDAQVKLAEANLRAGLSRLKQVKENRRRVGQRAVDSLCRRTDGEPR